MKTKLQTLAAMALTGILMGACGSAEQTEKGTKPVSVNVLTIQLTTNNQSKAYVGTVKESYGSELNFAVPGLVEKVYVSAGESVKQGQLLAVLDKESLESTVAAAKSTLNQAEDGYKRMKDMYDKGSLPEVKMVDIETKVANAKATLTIAQNNLKNTELRAPFAGVVAARNIDAGNYALPTSSAIKLVKIDNIDVKISVPENEISKVQIGQKATFSVSALDGQTFEGKVTEKGISANLLSHTYEVRITAQNSNNAIMPGMVCSVNLQTNNNQQQIIVVPNSAVKLDSNNSTYVWVVNNGIAQRRTVKVGNAVASGVVITSGLAEGDQVVTTGSQKISEGSKIAAL